MYSTRFFLSLPLFLALVVGLTCPLPVNAEPQEPALKEVATSEKVNINSASAAEIAASLKFIGGKRAAAIVAYRKENGPFIDIDQLQEVKGIGPVVIEKIRPFIAL